MKRLLSLALALVLALSLAACGSAPTGAGQSGVSQQAASASEPASAAEPGGSAAEPSGEEMSAWLKTKTGQFYSRFTNGMYMEYEMEYDGSVMTMVSASRGDKTYSESRVNGQSAGVSIMDGEYMYAVDHANKTVIKVSLQTSGQEIMDTMIEEGDVDPAKVVAGTREIDGATFDTEEWSLDGAKSTLCFDGGELAYMIGEFEGEETVMKIVKTSDQVDESLFEIPAEYQVMSY